MSTVRSAWTLSTSVLKMHPAERRGEAVVALLRYLFVSAVAFVAYIAIVALS